MLTLIWGSDWYRMRQEARACTKNLEPRVTIDAQEEDAYAQLHPHLSYQALIPETTTAVIVRNAQELSIDKELASFASSSSPCHVVLLYTTSAEPTKPQLKRVTTLQEIAGSTIHIATLSDSQRIAWLQIEAQGIGATLDASTARTLVGRVGPDNGALVLALRHLVASSLSGHITTKDLDDLIPVTTTIDQWELANAVGKLNKRAMITALHRQLAQGAGEYQLIGSLASGIRNLLMVAEHTAMNMPPPLIARATGIHPFVLSKITPTARTADQQKLRTFHYDLARLDQASKQGRVDVRDGLFALILTL